MSKLEVVMGYLELVKKDCVRLKGENDLTLEGHGMLIQILAIEELLSRLDD